MRRLRVHVSVEASEQLATLERRRRGMLRLEIRRVAGLAPDRRFVRVSTVLDIAACEVLDNQVILVYAVVRTRELLQMLWGSEVDRRVRHREASRLMHGRWSD